MSSSSKKVTVGYRYYMGLHFGVCHGPVDALLNIEIGDRTAWTGSQTSSGQIYINKPKLFGGDKREGGIQGYLDVMMGGSTQGANDYLTSKEGTPQPAYRGMLGAVYRRGLISATNPYIKNWAFKVRRIVQGWGNDGTAWYSAKAQITLSSGDIAMNPAHIIYQCLTDPTWGMGHNAGLIDNTSFTTAADTFYAEGMGLCLPWTRQGSVESFMQVVMDHAGAALGQDRRTGLFVLRAIRTVTSPSSLPLFDPTNITTLDSFQRTSIAETVNEVTVTYVDSTIGKTASVTVQNLSNITAQGGVIAQTTDYSGLPTYALAVRVAERDLRVASTPLAKVKFKTNRSAYALLPGDAIRFSWPKLGIAEDVLRILKIDYGDLANGEMTIDAVEDIFALPSASYVQQQQTLWQAPSTTAVAPTYYDMYESTYRDLIVNLGQTLTDGVVATSGYVYAVAERSSGVNLNFDLYTKVGAADYALAAPGDWTPTGVLSADTTAVATSISLVSTSGLEWVEVGETALIGSEIVYVSAINADTGAVTIARGCVDTVPKAWVAGTRVWFPEVYVAVDPNEYTSSEVVSGKFVTVTTTEELAIGSAPVDSVIVVARQKKPYPPGKLRIAGLAFPTELIDTAISATWVHRDRILQADQIISEGAASIGPEAGTTYSIRLYNNDTSALLTSADGLSVLTYSGFPTLTGIYNLRLELWSTCNGIASYQKHAHVFYYENVFRLTLENASGHILTEDNYAIVTE